jgi:hypothetical protein
MVEQTTTTKIQRGARRFRRFAYLAAAVAILCVVSEFALALAPLWRGGDKAQVPASLLAQALTAGPVLFFTWGLFRARRLFRRFETGDVFAAENSADFARIGWAVIGGAAWSLTLGGLAPPAADEVARQLASIGVAARDLALLSLGFALVVIGQVLTQARRLKLENDGFF